jgi:large subunit ribosomal protein L30
MATKKKTASSGKKLKVTLIRSPRGTLAAHKSSVLGLGLKKVHQTVEVDDSPCIRGMIHRAIFLLKVEA